ncbi:MAG: hypothetical protein JKY56_07130 [Kofleriaceae bacterium]|nr:hypothetical protein [Kofleriaceae bacterium]
MALTPKPNSPVFVRVIRGVGGTGVALAGALTLAACSDSDPATAIDAAVQVDSGGGSVDASFVDAATPVDAAPVADANNPDAPPSPMPPPMPPPPMPPPMPPPE